MPKKIDLAEEKEFYEARRNDTSVYRNFGTRLDAEDTVNVILECQKDGTDPSALLASIVAKYFRTRKTGGVDLKPEVGELLDRAAEMMGLDATQLASMIITENLARYYERAAEIGAGNQSLRDKLIGSTKKHK